MARRWSAPEQVRSAIVSARVRIYTTGACAFCRRAEALLAARGVEHLEKLRVDLDPKLLVEMRRLTGRRTVPQIFINEHHVGGYNELAAIDRDGALKALLTP